MSRNPVRFHKDIDERANLAKTVDPFDCPVGNAQIVPGFLSEPAAVPGRI